MDQIQQITEPCKQFMKDSFRLVKKCTKPDRKGNSLSLRFDRSDLLTDIAFNLEFQKIAMATAIGFAIMGFIGFFVKLIHIPINNIIVGS